VSAGNGETPGNRWGVLRDGLRHVGGDRHDLELVIARRIERSGMLHEYRVGAGGRQSEGVALVGIAHSQHRATTGPTTVKLSAPDAEFCTSKKNFSPPRR